MIKLFRNIRKNLLNEGKTSKYFKYAIGEITLVVIGILIALQINNWNQERLEGKKEQIVLNQLYKDFEANDSIIKKGCQFYEKQLAYNSAIIRHTGPNVIVPKDSNTKDSLFALEYPKVNLVNNSLNIPSQQFDILTNEELKVMLSTFPSTYLSYQEIENEIKNHAIAQRNFYKKYIAIIFMDSDFNQENFKSDLPGLLRDRNFQNVTLDKRWNLRNGLGELKGLHAQNLLVLELITKELKD